MRFMQCSVFNLAFHGMFMEYSLRGRPVLGLFAFLEMTLIQES